MTSFHGLGWVLRRLGGGFNPHIIVPILPCDKKILDSAWMIFDFLDKNCSSLYILVFSQHAVILGRPVLAAQ
jgi:hypothetical protein